MLQEAASSESIDFFLQSSVRDFIWGHIIRNKPRLLYGFINSFLNLFQITLVFVWVLISDSKLYSDWVSSYIRHKAAYTAACPTTVRLLLLSFY